MSGIEVAFTLVFVLLVPTLFQVLKLSIDQRRRYQSLNQQFTQLLERIERQEELIKKLPM